jgi:hypothetical protein
VDEKKPFIEHEEKIPRVGTSENADRSIEEEVQRKMDETVRRVREQSDR